MRERPLAPSKLINIAFVHSISVGPHAGNCIDSRYLVESFVRYTRDDVLNHLEALIELLRRKHGGQ